jgi:hypothetical protein
MTLTLALSHKWERELEQPSPAIGSWALGPLSRSRERALELHLPQAEEI